MQVLINFEMLNIQLLQSVTTVKIVTQLHKQNVINIYVQRHTQKYICTVGCIEALKIITRQLLFIFKCMVMKSQICRNECVSE